MESESPEHMLAAADAVPLPVKPILEAALLAAGQPLSLSQLAALFEDREPVSREDLRRALAELAEDCTGRGVELVEVASGYRFQVRREIHPWVARLWTERQSRYSRALLETLALIAYRQPITRGEIEQIRGVAVNSQIIRTLEEREWVRVVGHRDVPGRPELLGTTRAFLDYFNLRSLDELPPLAELRELVELEPELPLEGGEGTGHPAADAGSDTAMHFESAPGSEAEDPADTRALPAAEDPPSRAVVIDEAPSEDPRP